MFTVSQSDGERKPTTQARLYSETLDRILQEQLRLRKAKGKKPSTADLVQAAWGFYERRKGQRNG